MNQTLTTNSEITTTLSGIPSDWLARYASAATKRAVVERCGEDGSWFASIAGFRGVWANGDSEQEALRILEEVVFDWTALKWRGRDGDIPVVGGMDPNAW